MKITQVGEVVVKSDVIDVNGFAMEPEEDDPKDPEGLRSKFAETAAQWALGRLQFEVNRALAEAIRKAQRGEIEIRFDGPTVSNEN